MVKYLYHLSHTDLDGYGCQVLVDNFISLISEKHEIKARYFNSNYGNEITEKLSRIVLSLCCKSKSDLEETLVLITDLNLTDEQAKFIDEKSKLYGFKLLLLDHHQSGAMNSLTYDWYKYKEGQSGTLLTYDFIRNKYLIEGLEDEYFNSKVLEFLKDFNSGTYIIDTYDLWQQEFRYKFNIGTNLSFYLNLINSFFNRSEMEELHDKVVRYFLSYNLIKIAKIIDQYGDGNTSTLNAISLIHESLLTGIWSFYTKNYCNGDLGKLTNLENKSLPGIISELKVKFYREQFESNFLNISVVKDLEEKVLILYTKNGLNSVTLNGLIKEFSDHDVKAIVNCNSNGIVSCRSIGEFDVSKFAKANGGGGHKNAAGFSIDIKTIKSISKTQAENSIKDCNEYEKEMVLQGMIMSVLREKVMNFYKGDKDVNE